LPFEPEPEPEPDPEPELELACVRGRDRDRDRDCDRGVARLDPSEAEREAADRVLLGFRVVGDLRVVVAMRVLQSSWTTRAWAGAGT
jgi:hypothetical protein